jgi:hypothetical protein
MLVSFMLVRVFTLSRVVGEILFRQGCQHPVLAVGVHHALIV